MRKFIIGVILFFAALGPSFADSQGSPTGGTMGSQSTLSGCKYQSSPSTLTNGQQTGIGCDANQNLNVNVQAGSVTVISSVGSTFNPAQVALNNATATLVLSSLATPNGRNVCNLDTSINIFIGPSTVTSATGIRLTPGACWEAARTTAAIYAIAASGTPTAAGVQY